MLNNDVLILGKIDISSLLKAQSKFEKFCQSLDTEQEKAGAVQAFEYSFELCWKMLKRVLDHKGIISASPRDAFREGALNGYIRDPELWFDFIIKRSLALSVYDEENMEEVLACFPSFSKEITYLINELRNRKC